MKFRWYCVFRPWVATEQAGLLLEGRYELQKPQPPTTVLPVEVRSFTSLPAKPFGYSELWVGAPWTYLATQPGWATVAAPVVTSGLTSVRPAGRSAAVSYVLATVVLLKFRRLPGPSKIRTE